MENRGQAGEDLFNQFAEIKPPQDNVAIKGIPSYSPLDETNESLSSRMKGSPRMSDTQLVDSRLFPILKENLDWLNNLPVARVFPETIVPLRNIIVKELLKAYPDMPFAEAISIVEVALTIALDGEGRMDIIHLFSKMSDAGEDKDKNKVL